MGRVVLKRPKGGLDDATLELVDPQVARAPEFGGEAIRGAGSAAMIG